MLIGFYKEANLHKTVRKERLIALCKEANKQGDTLLIFELSGVDFLKKTIAGEIYRNNSFEKVVYPFPKVVINEAPKLKKNRNPLEDKLRAFIPFTTYLIGNKQDIYMKISKHDELSRLIIPTQKLNNLDTAISFLNKHNEIIAKPINGRQGKGIYKIKKENEKYIIDDSNKIKVLNIEGFVSYVVELVGSKNYILQKFITCKTKDNRVYDFRIHVQRNGEGQWIITKLYPRVGSENTFLSNISQGGYTEDINIFLKKEFDEESEFYKKTLEKTSLNLAEYINSFYSFKIDELGIDLAIDQNGDIWFYEANAGPQSKFHEEERALHTIKYSKYIANNFESKNLSITQKENYTIAMLAVNNKPSKLKYALACNAKVKGLDFYYFTSDNIDFENKKIKGYCYENEQWVMKDFDYPDYVYDRLLQRGGKKHGSCYRELQHIPFSNMKSPSGPLNKLKTYELMSRSPITKECLIPYKQVENPDTIIQFLDEYPQTICKIAQGTMGFNVLFIEKDGEIIRVKEQLIENEYDVNGFIDYVNEHIISSTSKYIVQPYIQSNTKAGNPYDLRTHLMKNRQGEWDIVKIYPRIGVQGSKVSNMHFGGSTCEINMFLKKHITIAKPKVFYNNLVGYAKKFATEFEKQFDFHFCEMALDIGIDENENMYIFEVNMNQIGNLLLEFEVAEAIVNYAKYYIELNS